MSPLEPPDSFALSAALGWIELKNLTEAEGDLAQISPENREHPTVLEVAWLLRAERRDWASALAVAGRLVELAPEESSGWLNRAYAARRAPGGSLEAAWELLLPAAEKFPTPGVVTIEALSKAPYSVPANRQIKTLVYIADSKPILILIRGDDQLNETKLMAKTGAVAARPATPRLRWCSR